MSALEPKCIALCQPSLVPLRLAALRRKLADCGMAGLESESEESCHSVTVLGCLESGWVSYNTRDFSKGARCIPSLLYEAAYRYENIGIL